MKIATLCPKSGFSKDQFNALSLLGDVVYTDKSNEYPVEELIKLAYGAEILAADPDNLGGFEKAKPVLTEVMESLPNLKGLCLSTTSFGWVDLNYCKSRNISVSNVPGYSSESVAEHALALMLCLAKKIIVSDRRAREGKYKLEMGFELRGKTLGIIGLGGIGSKTAELGKGIGMKVVAYNRSPKTMEGVETKSLDELLKESDVISLHTTHEDANKEIVNKEMIAKMKDGVIVINTVDRELVDEQAMAEALKSGKVAAYGVEVEDMTHGPLVGLENAIMIRGFGYYTKEAMANLYQIWTDNIVALAKGNPRNRVA